MFVNVHVPLVEQPKHSDRALDASSKDADVGNFFCVRVCALIKLLQDELGELGGVGGEYLRVRVRALGKSGNQKLMLAVAALISAQLNHRMTGPTHRSNQRAGVWRAGNHDFFEDVDRRLGPKACYDDVGFSLHDK